MEDLNSPNEVFDLAGLSAAEQQDLRQFAQGEAQKAKLQSSIHALTNTCFKKCITAKITQGQLDRTEQPCLQNCVDRFMDANMTILRHLETMRAGS